MASSTINLSSKGNSAGIGYTLNTSNNHRSVNATNLNSSSQSTAESFPRYTIAKEGWGSCVNFMRSHSLETWNEDSWQEGNRMDAIIDAEKENRRPGAKGDREEEEYETIVGCLDGGFPEDGDGDGDKDKDGCHGVALEVRDTCDGGQGIDYDGGQGMDYDGRQGIDCDGGQGIDYRQEQGHDDGYGNGHDDGNGPGEVDSGDGHGDVSDDDGSNDPHTSISPS